MAADLGKGATGAKPPTGEPALRPTGLSESTDAPSAAQTRGIEKVGPSKDYRALLRGEIASAEYVERLKARVDERFAQERRFRRKPAWRRWLHV